MSSRYVYSSDLKKRNIMFKKEQHSMLLRCLYAEHLLYSNYSKIDLLHDASFHYSYYLHFKRTMNSMFISRVHNRCVISGNARAVHSRYKLARFCLKMLSRQGQINGVCKAS